MKKILFMLLTVFPYLTKAGIDDKINEWFEPIADAWVNIVLFPVNFSDEISIPVVVLLLVLGALFFTIRFSFVNITQFSTAINTVRGKYDELEHLEEEIKEKQEKENLNDIYVDGDIPDTIKDENKEGEVSHFQALATAVSGTVGLGNIAGVALAITVGGPGATFWMIVCGLIGMSTKFVECTLGVKYRDVGEDGTVYGGPMYYLSKGLSENGFKSLGKAHRHIILRYSCL